MGFCSVPDLNRRISGRNWDRGSTEICAKHREFDEREKFIGLAVDTRAPLCIFHVLRFRPGVQHFFLLRPPLPPSIASIAAAILLPRY